MSNTARPTLEYARPSGPPPMPTGAIILLSLTLPGLGSLLLCGRRALRVVLPLNGAMVASVYAVGGPLALIPERPGTNLDDEAGWLLVAVYALVLGLGVRRALRDRRDLGSKRLPPAAPRVLWMTLFWVATAAAASGLAAALFALGRAHLGRPPSTFCRAFRIDLYRVPRADRARRKHPVARRAPFELELWTGGEVMRVPTNSGLVRLFVVVLGVLAQAGCMTASFVSQAFVEPGPPVVTGLIRARAGGWEYGVATGTTVDRNRDWLLVRYVVRDPIIVSDPVVGSHDYSEYGMYDFAVPLDAAGRPEAPFHYAGGEHTADRILADLSPAQRAAVRRARLRRMESGELYELARAGRIEEAASADFRWEVMRCPAAAGDSVAVFAYWPRPVSGGDAGPAVPPGAIPQGPTVLLLPASQPRSPLGRLLSAVIAVTGPYFALPCDLMVAPSYLFRRPSRSMPDRPVPAVGSRYGPP